MPAWRTGSSQMEGKRAGFRKVTEMLTPELWNHRDWVQVPAPLLAICVTLGSLLVTPPRLFSHAADKRNFFV